jgi:hypothetical protein
MPDVLFLFRLATELGKTVEEVMSMSSVEVRGWAEYFAYLNEQNKRANKQPRRR